MPEPEKSKPPDDAEQSARFLATAKEYEADKNSHAFKAALRVITPALVTLKTPAKKKPKE